MGPAVTLEKTSSVGEKRCFPNTYCSMLGSSRRHSGSISNYSTLEESHTISQNLRNLKRQWSYDCMTERSPLTSSSWLQKQRPDLEVEKSNKLWGACRKTENSKFQTELDLDSKEFGRLRGSDSSSVDMDSNERATPRSDGISDITSNVGSVDLKPINERDAFNENTPCTFLNVQQIDAGDCVKEKSFPSNGFFSKEVHQIENSEDEVKECHNNLEKMTMRSVKLASRVEMLMRRVRHLHKKKIQFSLTKYLILIQALLNKHETLGSSSKGVSSMNLITGQNSTDDFHRPKNHSNKSPSYLAKSLQLVASQNDKSTVISSSTSSCPSPPLSCSGSDDFTDQVMETFSLKVDNDNILKFVRHGVQSIASHLRDRLDPDATDESSSDEDPADDDDIGPGEGDGADKTVICISGKEASEMDWFRNQVGIMWRWKRIQGQVQHIQKELESSNDWEAKMMEEKRSRSQKSFRRQVRCDPEIGKIFISSDQTSAARCRPIVNWKRRKVVSSVTYEDTSHGRCNRCLNHYASTVPSYDDSCFSMFDENTSVQDRLSHVFWNRMGSTKTSFNNDRITIPDSIQKRDMTYNMPEVMSSHGSSNSWTTIQEDSLKETKKFLHKSKSTTRINNNQAKKQNVKSSVSKTGGSDVPAGHQGARRSHASNFDINNIILLPTNSSSRFEDFLMRKKDIDVPLWRYVPRESDSHHVQIEDTSDETYIRRHLEPETKEKRLRLPDTLPSARRHHHHHNMFSRSNRGRMRKCQRTNFSLDSDVFTSPSKGDRPDCREDEAETVKRTTFFSTSSDWSSTSHHSNDSLSLQTTDDKSMDRVSWFSNKSSANMTEDICNYLRNPSSTGAGDGAVDSPRFSVCFNIETEATDNLPPDRNSLKKHTREGGGDCCGNITAHSPSSTVSASSPSDRVDELPIDINSLRNPSGRGECSIDNSVRSPSCSTVSASSPLDYDL